MALYFTSPAEELEIVQRAAARSGCQVRALELRDTAAGRRPVGEVTCADGWGAARMLLASAIEDARTAGARDLALRLRREAPDDESFARRLHAYVKERVRFVREAGEVFQGSAYTLEMGAGDCDDHARAVYAIAIAGGLPARMAFLHRGKGPTHAVAQLGRRFEWAETTVDARFGEHPLRAAERLGLLRSRGDLSNGVVTMTEKDLPAPPHGFLLANPQERVASDVVAFQKLGYLPTCAVVTDPLDPRFRDACARFQRANPPLVVDGLIGPRTRGQIARELPQDEFGMGYLAALMPAAAAWSHTSDLPDAFFQKMKVYAEELGFDSGWMLDIAWAESGLNPAAKYRHPPDIATGLIGFVGIAWTGAVPDDSLASHDQFATIDAVTQLGFARRFWAPMKNKAQSAANLYQFNFIPLSVGRGTSPETVIAAKGGTGYNGQEGRFYTINRLLDVDGSGAITVADLAAHLERQKRMKNGELYPRYAEAAERLKRADPNAFRAPSVVPLIVFGVGVALALGAAIHYA